MPNQPANDIVVFWVQRSDSACADCGSPLAKGEAVHMSDGQPLCLECADLDHLVMCGAGNQKLTLRAKKYTGLWAVVVKWSSARKRYERQGLLVEEAAMQRAADECLEGRERDLWEVGRDQTSAASGRAAKALAKRIRALYPKCPKAASEQIGHVVREVYHGRSRRAAEDGSLTDDDLRLAVRAHLRHAHTNYDQLRLDGAERDAARAAVADEVAAIEAQWAGGAA